MKQATALDHLSGGRAWLGLGAGWHQRDHTAFGFDLPPVRERLDRLDEQSAAVRALLDGREVTVDGAWVRMDRAVNDPPPLGRLPLLIGGSGEKRTLRIVARDADAWNGEGSPAGVGAPLRDPGRTLRGRSAATRPGDRADRGRADAPRPGHARGGEALARRDPGAQPHAGAEAAAIAEADALAGTLADVLATCEAWAAAGAEELIIDWPAPFDVESLERLAAALRWGGT